MKKILSIIAVLTFIFAGCDSGNIVGGHYYGTFQNTANGLREAGSLNFKYSTIDNATCFLMNGILPMTQTDENKFFGMVGNNLLNDLLKTIPAIDSLHVCDSAETIIQMSAEAEFKGGSVKSNLIFTTSNDSSVVNVEFIGYFE